MGLGDIEGEGCEDWSQELVALRLARSWDSMSTLNPTQGEFLAFNDIENHPSFMA
jgi:hypothetical protein